MSNDYYSATAISSQTLARASSINAIMSALEAGFDMLPGAAALQQSRWVYHEATGAANTYAITMTPTLTSYVAGLGVRVKIPAANTATSATLNVDGVGARSIKRIDGSLLAIGELATDSIVDLCYNGTDFLMMSPTPGDLALAIAALAAAPIPYGSRTIAENTVVPAAATRIAVTVNGEILDYVKDATGTALTTGDGATWSPAGEVTADHWFDNASPGTTEIHVGLQAAADWMDANAKGTLHFRATTYRLGATVNVAGFQEWVGKFFYIRQDYVDGALETAGTFIEAKDGLNDNLIYVTETDLPGSGYPRIFFKMRNMAIHGRRSENWNPTNVDLNSTGHGVHCRGVSHFHAENVLFFRCAEDGFHADSADYDLDTIFGEQGEGTNNLNLWNCKSHQNHNDGFNVEHGDSIFIGLEVGYNGKDGINTVGGHVSNCKAWNNVRYGGVSSGDAVWDNFEAYDNGSTGLLGSSGDFSVVGGSFIDNGRLTAGSGNERAGIGIRSDVTKFIINGVTVGRRSYGGKSGYGAGNQLYGISATTGTPDGMILGVLGTGIDVWDPGDAGSAVDLIEVSIADPRKVRFQQFNAWAYDFAALSVYQNLFSVSDAGQIYEVQIAHIGGDGAAICWVIGDNPTPKIIDQKTVGAAATNEYTFNVSSLTLQVKTGGTSQTSDWKMRKL